MQLRTSVKPLPLVQALMLVLTLGSTAAMNAQAQGSAASKASITVGDTTLIPRTALFGNPVKAGAQLFHHPLARRRLLF